MRRTLYLATGFILGFLAAGIFSARMREAQAAIGIDAESTGFSFDRMEPAVPASFGRLVAVNGIDLYYENQDGTVYIVKPRSGNSLDTRVTMIPRS
ncbi:MAG: hypothetical protein ACM3L6_01105 [Deltaproteobacteria bacterium]